MTTPQKTDYRITSPNRILIAQILNQAKFTKEACNPPKEKTPKNSV